MKVISQAKAISVSLLVVYTNTRVKKGKQEASKLINGLIEILFPVFILIFGFVFFSSPIIASVLAPSYKGEQVQYLSSYIRVLAPVILFGCFELVFGAVLESNKSFYISRLNSLIYSSIVIVFCICLSQSLGINALVFAQYASNVVFTILLLVSIRKYHSFFVVKFKEIPELKTILYTAIPLFIGNSTLQINQIVDKSITSGLGEGAASALSYCHTLEQFVTSILIVNIGNVLFAHFAEFVAKNEIDRIKSTLSHAIDNMIIFLLSTSTITVICASDIVSIVYYRGSFTSNAVTLTSMALIGYAFSFPVVAIRNLTIKSLYAYKNTKNPMYGNIVTIIINIILSIILS